MPASQRRPASPTKETLALTSSTVLALILVSLLYIIAARNSEPSSFGIAAAVIAIAAAVTAIVDFGNISYSLREVAARNMRRRRFFRRLSGRILALSVWFAASAALAHVARQPLWLFAGIIPLVRLPLQSALVALRAHHRILTVVLVTLLDAVVAIGALLGLLSLGVRGDQSLLMAVLLGDFAATAVAMPLAFRSYVDDELATDTGGTSSTGFGLSAVAVAAADLNVPVAAWAASPAVAGEYSAVNRWTRPVLTVMQSFNLMAAPRIAAAPSAMGAWRSIRGASWLPMLAAVYCLVLAALASYLVPLVLGDAYVASITPLVILALGSLLIIPNSMAVTFLQYRGFDAIVGRAQLATTSIGILLTIPLSVGYGATGMALALLGQRVLASALLALLVLNLHVSRRGSSLLSLIRDFRASAARSMRGP